MLPWDIQSKPEVCGWCWPVLLAWNRPTSCISTGMADIFTRRYHYWQYTLSQKYSVLFSSTFSNVQTGVPVLSSVVQARRLSLFGHIARMPDETDARSIITASPLENWRRPPGRPRTTWMKTIQQVLRSNNLSLDEVITVAQIRPLWRLMSVFGATHW